MIFELDAIPLTYTCDQDGILTADLLYKGQILHCEPDVDRIITSKVDNVGNCICIMQADLGYYLYKFCKNGTPIPINDDRHTVILNHELLQPLSSAECEQFLQEINVTHLWILQVMNINGIAKLNNIKEWNI